MTLEDYLKLMPLNTPPEAREEPSVAPNELRRKNPISALQGDENGLALNTKYGNIGLSGDQTRYANLVVPLPNNNSVEYKQYQNDISNTEGRQLRAVGPNNSYIAAKEEVQKPVPNVKVRMVNVNGTLTPITGVSVGGGYNKEIVEEDNFKYAPTRTRNYNADLRNGDFYGNVDYKSTKNDYGRNDSDLKSKVGYKDFDIAYNRFKDNASWLDHPIKNEKYELGYNPSDATRFALTYDKNTEGRNGLGFKLATKF